VTGYPPNCPDDGTSTSAHRCGTCRKRSVSRLLTLALPAAIVSNSSDYRSDGARTDCRGARPGPAGCPDGRQQRDVLTNRITPESGRPSHVSVCLLVTSSGRPVGRSTISAVDRSSPVRSSNAIERSLCRPQMLTYVASLTQLSTRRQRQLTFVRSALFRYSGQKVEFRK